MSWDYLYQRSYHRAKGYPEACVIKGKSGRYYPGVRIENASFPVTIPAIQAACCYCLSEGDLPEVLITRESKPDQLDFWVSEFDLKHSRVSDIRDISFDQSPLQLKEQEILKTLSELHRDAVVPNSDFPVSALLLTDQGWISGVNVEVSSWTHGLCAERVALAKAFALGLGSFKRMAVYTRKGEFCSPCGACRQVVFEHLDDHPMDLYHPDGTLSRHYTVDLLPYHFKSKNL